VQGPTSRQLEVLRLLDAGIRDHNKPPTLREMGEAMGMSHGAVRDHVIALAQKGLIVRFTERLTLSRIKLTPAGQEALKT